MDREQDICSECQHRTATPRNAYYISDYLVSWVNLTESERAASEAHASSSDQTTSPALTNSPITRRISPLSLDSAIDTVRSIDIVDSSSLPEFAVVVDEKSGEKVVYKRMDRCSFSLDSIIDWVVLERDRVGISVLIASNILMFAIGYVCLVGDNG